MLSLFTIFAATFLLSSCATTFMSAVNKSKPAHPYINLMVVFVKDAPEITRLDETTYNTYLKTKFNNLADIKLRKQVEETFAENVTTEATAINRSSQYFKVGDEYNYAAFLSKVKESGAEGIIVVNNTSRSSRTNYTTLGANSDVSYSVAEQAPSAVFLCYLLDLESKEPVWMSQADVSGNVYADYYTLTNSLARNVGSKLRKEGYIYVSVKDVPVTYTNATPAN
jgi:hypothetical protein